MTEIKRINRTGKEPVNSEPPGHILLQHDITPIENFYTRCHGVQPDLAWDTHKLEFYTDDDLVKSLSMDELKDFLPPVSLMVTMACDGNRRKELNVVGAGKPDLPHHSNGFNWGCCAVSTGMFKGLYLRDLLRKVYSTEKLKDYSHVAFESADTLPKGHYGTSLLLTQVLLDDCDFLVAYGMNGQNLPKEHGFPVRTILPGYVGGRTVKWLKKIILLKQESNNFYHIHDNSVFPQSVTSSALMSNYINENERAYSQAEISQRQPSILYEMNVNSAILSPIHGKVINISGELLNSCVFEGYAYDGGGRLITRVQVTLDGGDTWYNADHSYPYNYIPEHGTKYYVMCKWKIALPIWKIASSKNLSVRAWNQSFNTQSKEYAWNLLGMMNNAWYTVEFERKCGDSLKVVHPVSLLPKDEKGWLEKLHPVSRYEEKYVPPVFYTRQEVKTHNTISDCWVIVDDKVYDLTDFLNMHPGGQSSILTHAGEDVATLFYDIHSEDTHVLKAAYVIGSVSDAEDGKDRGAQHAFLGRKHPRKTPDGHEIELNSFKWTPVHLVGKEMITHNTRRFTFSLSSKDKRMWLPWGKHVNIGVELPDRMVVRPYTPVKPIKKEEDNGTFELIIKIYFPAEGRPGGEMTGILEKLSIGDQVLVKGPEGVLWYFGNGQFSIRGHFFYCLKMNFIVGGTGITPALAIMRAVLLAEKLENVSITLFFANKTVDDILCREELDELMQVGGKIIKVIHVISNLENEKDCGDNLVFEKGRVNAEIFKKYMAKDAADDSSCFVCGPPAMIAKSVLPALAELGFDDDQIYEF